MGAAPSGIPGCPDLATSTWSTERKRSVFTHRSSRGALATGLTWILSFGSESPSASALPRDDGRAEAADGRHTRVSRLKKYSSTKTMKRAHSSGVPGVMRK